MKPLPGHYREIIAHALPMVRIALTNFPMSGVTKVSDTWVLEILQKSTDPFAQYYIDGLINGTMITIVENQSRDKYFSIGELYFKS